jgi:prepilin-type N-terminal cleavage/methylation domain-containing protein
MKKFSNQKGFTLVEMILYVAICSILLATISMFLSFLLGARVRSQSITEVNQQGFQVMNLITQTIRNGRSIEVPNIGTSSTTLSVTTGNALLDPTVFTLSSSTILIQEGSKGKLSLTNSRITVTNLLFENVSSVSSIEKIIRISFTINSVNKGGRSEYAFSKSFSGSATLR